MAPDLQVHYKLLSIDIGLFVMLEQDSFRFDSLIGIRQFVLGIQLLFIKGIVLFLFLFLFALCLQLQIANGQCGIKLGYQSQYLGHCAVIHSQSVLRPFHPFGQLAIDALQLLVQLDLLLVLQNLDLIQH